MIITNSLGSNYTTEDVRRSLALLFHEPPPDAQEKLAGALAAMFGVPPTSIQLFSKGRHALEMALYRIGVGPQDEIILQAFTCAVLPEAILKLGATPVYIDAKPHSLNPSLPAIKIAVTKRTKAVILQHTLGYVNPENDAIVSWCSSRGITVIQDLAHAFGAPGLRRIGSFLKGSDPGMPIVLSFSQDKIVDGVSGGALVFPGGIFRRNRTSDLSLSNDSNHQSTSPIAKFLLYPIITRCIRSTYNVGVGRGIHFLAKNLNLLPSPLDAPDNVTPLPYALAVFALEQLKCLNNIIAHRRNIALLYDRLLHQVLKLVTATDIRNGTNLRYPIWVHDRETLEKHLQKHGFYLADHWYDAPVAPAWHTASSSYQEGSSPNAEALSRHIFNLPTHINVSEKQAYELAKLINNYAK